jgi:hypothetical protein
LRSLLRRLEAAAAASALESENRQLREILERALGQQRAAAILPPAATRPEDRGQKEPRTKPMPGLTSENSSGRNRTGNDLPESAGGSRLRATLIRYEFASPKLYFDLDAVRLLEFVTVCPPMLRG